VSTGRALPTRLLLGLAGGLAISLGLVALLVARRRPIIDVTEAAAVCGSEPLGTLSLPTDGVTRSAGVSPLLRLLGPVPDATWTFVAAGDEEEPAAAVRLRNLVASALASSGELQVVPDRSAEPRPAVAELATGTRRTKVRPLAARAALPEIVVRTARTGQEAIDSLRGPGPDDRTVLVVCDGSRASRAAEVASDFLPDDVTGVVFVQRASRRRRVRPMLWTAARHLRIAPPRARAAWPVDDALASPPAVDVAN
jgi:hypothetical protein